ncbi:MAG: prepilin-type N-terminal cleavage/methylation domain-containing protein [Desulfuromonadaceae bacterium]|nr:prepilin-type N-terminal cleavage/methylation domain-containing protein [Desulfuromonadaceae bacterium]
MMHARGFTLMELLTVIAILSILMAFALPALGTFRSDAAEKEAARGVLGALREARNLAISQNLEHQLAFDMDSKSYWLERGDKADNSTSWTRIRTFGGFSGEAGMAMGAECTKFTGDGDTASAENRIQFNPNGTCGSKGTASARYVCVLGQDGSKQFRTGIPSSITGRAVIQRWNGGWE